MRERRALGAARRAARELDVDRIGGRERRADRIEQRGIDGLAAARHHVREAEHAGRRDVAHRHDRAQARHARRMQVARRRGREFRRDGLQHLDVRGRLEALGGDHGFTADLVQRVFEFREPVGRIDVDEHRADPRGRELREQPFAAVRRPDADAIALHDAERGQPGRQHVDLVRELAPGPAHLLLAEHDGRTIGKAAGRVEQEPPDRRFGERHVGRAAHVRQSVFGRDQRPHAKVCCHECLRPFLSDRPDMRLTRVCSAAVATDSL
ncbi:Uncharacterised protein [Burkholderia cepacia]|uniref:Uncharacterized protein n=1 Tax=Burkholderia cepacia TaxID=292 RepID=A0AAE8NF79_BURCE|nr:Uncharacterised protein [Burkholderia cepacia]